MALLTRVGTSSVCLCLAVAAILGLTPSVAPAATRTVLAEDFMATWVVYDPSAGRALNMMINNHPADFTFIQIHGSNDPYRIPWGQMREAYYAVAGYPTAWFDGKVKAEGAYENENLQYSWYNSIYNQRKGVATDVTVSVGGVLVSGQTYAITVRVALDPNGIAKTVRVYAVHALDHYPSSSDNRYRNCLRLPTAPPYVDVALTPGMTADVLHWNCTFDSTSWAQQSDIRIIAWAQKQATYGGAGAGELWNAKMMSWPFSDLPSLYMLGDLDCSGAVNSDDINPFVLAVSDPVAYQAAFPACDVNLADCNDDGWVNFDDINAFVALLAGGQRSTGAPLEKSGILGGRGSG
jgi:hypothetical protein